MKKVLTIGLVLAMASMAQGVALQLLDDDTGNASKDVAVAPAGEIVTISVLVNVDLLSTQNLDALAGGITVDAGSAGEWQIDSYTYNSPFDSVFQAGPPMVLVNYLQAGSPVGVLDPTNPAGGVGLLYQSNTFGDPSVMFGHGDVGVLEISSVNPVTPGTTVTFSPTGTQVGIGLQYSGPQLATLEVGELYDVASSEYPLSVESFTLNITPEPSTALFLLIGGLLAYRRRR